MRYSKMLEESAFQNRRADYVWLLMVSSVLLLVSWPRPCPSIYLYRADVWPPADPLAALAVAIPLVAALLHGEFACAAYLPVAQTTRRSSCTCGLA